jgi:Uma2 family endonuclease
MQSPFNMLTVTEYLEAEKSSDIRHEYVAGQVFAMAGASEEHNLIVTNIIAILRPHLRGSSCRAFISDMKVKVKIRNANIFYYPDVIVTCDPEDNERYFKTRPNLIIEVLSNSTAKIDKREKRINYQTIDSLKEYVLVYQDQIKVEIYRQDDQGNWSTEVLGKEDKIRLDSVDLTLMMADLYEDVMAESKTEP